MYRSSGKSHIQVFVFLGGVVIITSTWIHAEHAMFVPADDAIRNLSISLCVAASCLHSEQLRAHGHILGNGGRILTVLKHWRIVVDIQDRDHYLAERGQTRQALVADESLQLIC